jgi:hypothetical protein
MLTLNKSIGWTGVCQTWASRRGAWIGQVLPTLSPRSRPYHHPPRTAGGRDHLDRSVHAAARRNAPAFLAGRRRRTLGEVLPSCTALRLTEKTPSLVCVVRAGGHRGVGGRPGQDLGLEAQGPLGWRQLPLGYASVGKKLVIVPEDAETLRTMFRLYLECGSIGPRRRCCRRRRAACWK